MNSPETLSTCSTEKVLLSTPKRPVVHLYMSTPQSPEWHLNMDMCDCLPYTIEA
jgi:hypothetical protein